METSTSVTSAQFMTSIRYLLVSGGAWLVGKGYLTNDALTAALPVAMVVLPYLWGLWHNWQKEQEAKKRETVAVRAGVALANDVGIPTPAPQTITPAEAQTTIAAYAPETKP